MWIWKQEIPTAFHLPYRPPKILGRSFQALPWYSSSDITKDSVGKLCSTSDGDLKLQVDTSAKGTNYYRCVVTCKVNGLEGRITYPAYEWAKVTVTEKVSNPMTFSAVSKQSTSVTKKGQAVTFEVTATNTNGNVSYAWYECDASGKPVDNVVIGTDKKLVVSSIDGNYGDTYYYKCIARDSKDSDSLMFTATVLYENDTSTLPILPNTNNTGTNNTDTSKTTSKVDTSNNNTSDPDTNTNETSEFETSTLDSIDIDTSKIDSIDTETNDAEASESYTSDPASSDSDSSRSDKSKFFR